MSMTDDQRFWDLTRAIAEPPADPHELRTHLLDAHSADPEVVPSNEQLAGLQALHIKLHAQGADHSHYGISTGSGVQPFGDGVKSSGPREQYRCRRCGQMKDRALFNMGMWRDGHEGQLSCVACFEGVLTR